MKLKNEQIIWLSFFMISSWIILSTLLLSQKIMNIWYHYNQDKSDLLSHFQKKEIPMIITNPKDKESIDLKEKLYRSNRFSEGRGKLTIKKGFKNLSMQDKLKIKDLNQAYLKEGHQQEPYSFTSKIIDERSIFKYKQKQHKKRQTKQTLSLIPDSYEFQYEYAFSWTKEGLPQIPSYYFKYYKYFRDMSEKIRDNWVPPGGIPVPTYGNEYHRMQYVPGHVRLRRFPPQEIAISFMVDHSGEVLDIKMMRKSRFKSLNISIVEAISNSKNFGPPPKELLHLNIVIFPWVFRIY